MKSPVTGWLKPVRGAGVREGNGDAESVGGVGWIDVVRYEGIGLAGDNPQGLLVQQGGTGRTDDVKARNSASAGKSETDFYLAGGMRQTMGGAGRGRGIAGNNGVQAADIGPLRRMVFRCVLRRGDGSRRALFRLWSGCFLLQNRPGRDRMARVDNAARAGRGRGQHG